MCITTSVLGFRTNEGLAIREVSHMSKLAFSSAIILLSAFSGTGWAGQMECKPYCVALTASSHTHSSGDRKEGDHQGQGQQDADNVSSEHGSVGRDNARQKQNAHRRKESGVSASVSDSTSLSAPNLEQNRMDPRGIAPTCSLC